MNDLFTTVGGEGSPFLEFLRHLRKDSAKEKEEESYSKRQTLVKFAANQTLPGLTIGELVEDVLGCRSRKNLT